uniref:Uncharacterized protein n=1 Tax=Anguilla anguilla TaxID=7936 RepID=A0A0E9XKL6_ANGAN
MNIPKKSLIHSHLFCCSFIASSLLMQKALSYAWD